MRKMETQRATKNFILSKRVKLELRDLSKWIELGSTHISDLM